MLKELLENAVDAGATEIRVEIQQAGTSQIRVTDNSLGMSLADLSRRSNGTLPVKSKAPTTSMLCGPWASGGRPCRITAVSRTALNTLPRGAAFGHRLDVWGGEKKGLQEIAGTAGTTVEVNDLFYNTPARLAFLKSPRVEWGRIQAAFDRVALGFPEIQMSLHHNGKKVIRLLPTGQREFRLEELWGEGADIGTPAGRRGGV